MSLLSQTNISFHAITAAPLINELAHPRLRAIAASAFLSTYYIGSIIAAWLCYGMTQVSWLNSKWVFISRRHIRYNY
jgi:hypothetical protein